MQRVPKINNDLNIDNLYIIESKVSVIKILPKEERIENQSRT